MNDKVFEWVVALMGVLSAATTVFAVGAWLVTGKIGLGLVAIPMAYWAVVCLASSETRNLLRRLRRRTAPGRRPLIYSLTVGVEPLKVSEDLHDIVGSARMLAVAVSDLVVGLGVEKARAGRALNEAWEAINHWERQVTRRLSGDDDVVVRPPIIMDFYDGLVRLVADEDVE